VEPFRRRRDEGREPPSLKVSQRDSEEAAEREDEPASPPTGAGLRRTALELAERIDEILAIAERAAVAIQEDAEASAERYLRERRHQVDRELGERLRDADRDLEERAAAIAETSSSLRQEADRALKRLTALERDNRVLGRLPSTEVESDLSTAGAADSTDEIGEGPAPAEALLRAAQMAVAGRSREEIERVLTVEFGTESPDLILDEILGR
jgi:hypothetical protein